MTTTNYLSPTDFKKMVDAIPLVTEYNKSKLVGIQKNKVPNPILIQEALWVQYCCGLRVSEVLTLKADDFDFHTRVLKLSRTKTGWKNCKCSKWKKKKLLSSNPDCKLCYGKGKLRKVQHTSIPPDFPQSLEEEIENELGEKTLFPFTRHLIWSYVKKAAKMAKLELAEQQDERFIEGAWTHLIRKSRAKMMIELGASEVMVKVKLRHTFSVTERYTKPDINALILWESKNIT